MSDSKPRRAPWWMFLAVVLLTAFGYASGIDSPFFDDETAYITQSYYYRLWSEGKWNDVDWLHYTAYDHMPFFKYLIGFSLHRHGRATPTTIQPAEDWFTAQGKRQPPADPVVLRAGRVPMLLGAALGCGLMFELVRRLIGVKTALLATIFLYLSPLYAVHARRAMSDDLTQAWVLASLLAFVTLAERIQQGSLSIRTVLTSGILLGLATGLAVSTKLNGASAGLVVALTFLLFLLSNPWRVGPPLGLGRWGLFFSTTLLAGILGIAFFFAINPFFFARPSFEGIELSGNPPTVVVSGVRRSAAWLEHTRELAEKSPLERLKIMLRHRTEGLQEGMELFPNDALPTRAERAAALFREGLGKQTFLGLAAGIAPIPAILGTVLIVLGLRFVCLEGQRQLAEGAFPTTWILFVWPLVESISLINHLTLNWDRYYMGFVSFASLLMAVGIGGTLIQIGRRLVLQPPSRSETA